jgi:predicted PurR-regulated permease PerM
VLHKESLRVISDFLNEHKKSQPINNLIINMSQSPEQRSEKPIWRRISTNSLIRFLLFFACGWALIEILRYFEYVIFVFSFAAILALILNYPVSYLRRYLKRGAALGVVIAATLLTIIVAVVTIGQALANQLQQLIASGLQILNSGNNPLEQLQANLAIRNIPLNLEIVEAQLRNVFQTSLNWLVGSLPVLLQNYVTFIIILVIAFFMLIDGDKLWRLVLKAVPRHQRSRFQRVVYRSFVGFIRGQLLISFLLSVATFIVFVLFQVPFPLVLAIAIGIFDLIPGIGATLGVSLACFAILVYSGWLTALKVLITCVVLQQIQDNVVSPRIMQSTVHLNPLVVFLALLIGGQVAGLLGVLLSVPVSSVIVSLLEIEEMQAD